MNAQKINAPPKNFAAQAKNKASGCAGKDRKSMAFSQRDRSEPDKKGVGAFGCLCSVVVHNYHTNIYMPDIPDAVRRNQIRLGCGAKVSSRAQRATNNSKGKCTWHLRHNTIDSTC